LTYRDKNKEIKDIKNERDKKGDKRKKQSAKDQGEKPKKQEEKARSRALAKKWNLELCKGVASGRYSQVV